MTETHDLPDESSRKDPTFRYTAALADQIERKWQDNWQARGTYRQPNPGEPGFDATRPKFFCLDMFPYPSGAGLHVGHPEGYTATDILCRYKRMRGFNVLHPMGWDAFGLPAEQYAIRTGVHPAVTTKQSIDTFRRQLQRFGFSYDWTREFATIEPEYYKWTQWIFLQIYNAFYDADAKRGRPLTELIAEFENGKRPVRFNPDASEHSIEEKDRAFGAWSSVDAKTQRRIVDSYRLAYVGVQTVNWCPKLGTALANEEVIDGKSERGGFAVFRKPLKQWMFRITSYADRLLDGLKDVQWPDATRAKQTDWIGRSEGAVIDFPLSGETGAVRVYTTRPDTIFGATFMVVAPEHPLVARAIAASPERAEGIRAYVDAAKNRSDLDRQTAKEKTGVDLGLRATNPATGETVPVWTADYVLMTYGHGAIMAVPAHDDRDHEFATKFGLPVVTVVEPLQGVAEGCFAEAGRNINSSNSEVSLDGLATSDAKAAIIAWLARKGLGRVRVNYKLRDWLFSRQRYWGEPFPIVWDAEGNHHGLDVSKLPLVLPTLTDYAPDESDDPKPLLAKAVEWVQTTAEEAGVTSLAPNTAMTRETNTMPGWAGSCWYYIRFADPGNAQRFIGKEAEGYWLGEEGVDQYVGGAEHAVLHLLYARFWHKVLKDLGHVKSEEPFRKLFHQGLITSYSYQRDDRSLVPTDEVDEVSEGKWIERATSKPVAQVIAKMSKSLKNVVNPDDIIASYGADTFRLYEMYMGPLDMSKPWNTKDILGMYRFLARAWRLCVNEETGAVVLVDAPSADVEKLLHRTIARVGADIERLAFNTAIAGMVGFVNGASSHGLSRDQMERFLRVLGPFAPHLTEDVWHRLGNTSSIAEEPWPTYEEAMLRDDSVEIAVQIKSKVRGHLVVPTNASKEEIESAAKLDPAVAALLAGKKIMKVIVVPGRLINFITD